MRRVVFLLGVLFAVAGWTGAHAESVIDEVRVGVLAQSCCGYSPDNEQGVGINLETAFRSPDFLRIIGAPRPVIGGTVATDSDGTNHAYAALEWRYDFSKYFVSGAVGGAVHDGTLNDGGDPFLAARGDTIFFGCRVLIKVGLSAGVRLTDSISAAAHWSHISNGTLCRPNNGLDQLGVRIGVGF